LTTKRTFSDSTPIGVQSLHGAAKKNYGTGPGEKPYRPHPRADLSKIHWIGQAALAHSAFGNARGADNVHVGQDNPPQQFVKTRFAAVFEGRSSENTHTDLVRRRIVKSMP
jgi:hypothetical protein